MNVDTSSTLNYNELKEDVRALTKEIKVTKIVHPHSEEVKLMTKEESKETSFLHFWKQEPVRGIKSKVF